LSSSQISGFRSAHGGELEVAWALRIRPESAVHERIEEFRAFSGLARLQGGCLLQWRLTGTPTPERVAELRVTRAPEAVAEFDRKNRFFGKPSQVPQLAGYEFVSAQRLSVPAIAGDYIGIWKGKQDRVIASFADSSAQQPKILARTRMPIQYVSATPAIHGDMILFRLLSEANQSFDLIDVNWYPSKQVARR
jgi:hypothetical protein